MKKIICKIKIDKKYAYKKNLKQKIHLVFTRVFNFQGGSLEFTHAFSHYYLPFPKKFGQVMHFYKFI
jgi:hypothetical protein